VRDISDNIRKKEPILCSIQPCVKLIDSAVGRPEISFSFEANRRGYVPDGAEVIHYRGMVPINRPFFEGCVSLCSVFFQVSKQNIQAFMDSSVLERSDHSAHVSVEDETFAIRSPRQFTSSHFIRFAGIQALDRLFLSVFLRGRSGKQALFQQVLL
jgi:hypothetical protein